MYSLEEKLLHSDFSHTPQALDALLATDFVEVSASGTQNSRAAVCQWLLQKDKAARWDLSDLSVLELGPTLRLVRYHALQIAPVRSGSKGALHVSLWCCATEGASWQMSFHQSTKVL